MYIYIYINTYIHIYVYTSYAHVYVNIHKYKYIHYVHGGIQNMYEYYKCDKMSGSREKAAVFQSGPLICARGLLEPKYPVDILVQRFSHMTCNHKCKHQRLHI